MFRGAGELEARASAGMVVGATAAWAAVRIGDATAGVDVFPLGPTVVQTLPAVVVGGGAATWFTVRLTQEF